MSKIPVYFMPGLAASSKIFENIKLPIETFEVHYLEWFTPNKKESLEAYAKRMSELVKKDNPVLIGVSFGGILVQEMAKFLNPKKVIIISSVRANVEFPKRMKIAKTTKAYKLLPTSLLLDIELLTKYAFGSIVKNRIELYKKYIYMNNKVYLDWAIENVICWKQSEINKEVVHIHGDKDSVFPSKNLTNFIAIKGGTHLIIINRFKWFNENLPKIILD